jgi:hypothetical protein
MASIAAGAQEQQRLLHESKQHEEERAHSTAAAAVLMKDGSHSLLPTTQSSTTAPAHNNTAAAIANSAAAATGSNAHVLSGEMAQQVAAEKERLRKLADLKHQLSELLPVLEAARGTNDKILKDKTDEKNLIKAWCDNFEKVTAKQ